MAHPGRKPAHLAAIGKPYGRQAIWDWIRRDRDGFSIASLAIATDIPLSTIKTYLVGLEAAGYIAIRRPDNVFVLIRDVGVEAPRVTKDGKPVTQGLAREQMWRCMRMAAGDWSWRDLAVMASTEAMPVSEVDAKDYCGHLARAGYLIVTVKGKGMGKGANPSRYRLAPGRNTGPRPPMVQRLKTVFDANLGKVMWQEPPHDD